MAANHKVIGFGKLDGNRAESEDDRPVNNHTRCPQRWAILKKREQLISVTA